MHYWNPPRRLNNHFQIEVKIQWFFAVSKYLETVLTWQGAANSNAYGPATVIEISIWAWHMWTPLYVVRIQIYPILVIGKWGA